MSEHVQFSKPVVEKPEGVYPLNAEDPFATSSYGNSKEYVYPDFRVWQHTEDDDIRMRNYLQKGYFEPPLVSNEFLSARTTMTTLLHSDFNDNTNNAKLNALSDFMIKAINQRRNLSKIRSKSSYKPPPRVTLTDNKKEKWIENLADSRVSLKQLSRAIPHGIRNRILLEQCSQNAVPIPRALWLIRCVSTNEQRQLKRKGNASNAVALMNNWVTEWTEQVTLYIEKVYENCFSDRAHWRARLIYITKLTAQLYMENLLNQEALLAWIVHSLRRIAKQDSSLLDFKHLATHMVFLRLFWFKIINVDYLSKEMAEQLLRISSALTDALADNKTQKSLQESASKLLANVNFFITYLFYYNSDSFIIPTTWVRLRSALKKVIDLNNNQINEQFKLVSYRNESLIIDLPTTGETAICSGFVLVKRLDDFEGSISGLSDLIFYSTRDTSDSNDSWKHNLRLMLEWAITGFRGSDTKRVALVVSILQWRLHQMAANGRGKRFKALKLELEVQILDFIYALNDKCQVDVSQTSLMSPISDTDTSRNDVNFENVFVLVCELYYHDMFVVSSYVRRLIASGVIYLQDAANSCGLHALILRSLPVLNDTNVNNILKSLRAKRTDSSELVKDIKEKIRLFLDSTREEPEGFPDEVLEQIDQLETGLRFIIAKEVSQKLYDLATQCSGTPNKLRFSLNVVSSLYRLFEKLYGLYLFLDRIVIMLDKYGDCFEIDIETVNFIVYLVASNDDVLARRISSSKQYCNSFDEKVAQVVSMAGKYNRKFVSVDVTRIRETCLSEEVKQELKGLKSEQCRDQSDKTDLSTLPLHHLQSLGIQSVERLMNPSEFAQHTVQIVSHYWSFVKANDRESRLELLKLLKVLKASKPADFDAVLNGHIKKTIAPVISIEFDVNVRFISRMIVDGLLSFADACEAFAPSGGNDALDMNSGQRLVWNLLLNPIVPATGYEKNLYALERCESIIFELARREFQLDLDDYLALLMKICRQNMMGDIDEPAEQHRGHSTALGSAVDHLPTPVSNSMATPLPMIASPLAVEDTEIPPPYRDELIRVLRIICIKDTQKALQWMQSNSCSSISQPQLIEMFNQMLLEQNLVTTAKDTFKLVGTLNYFNLPICQVLVKLLFDEEFRGSEEEQAAYMYDIVNSILVEAYKWTTKDYWKDELSLLGDMLKYVEPPLKLKLLHCCEEIYLGSELFPKAVLSNSPSASVIPFLASLIGSCSNFADADDYKPGSIPLTDSLVFSLNLSVEKLMYFCQKYKEDDTDEELETSIALLARIILIHRVFLVDLVLKRSVNLQTDVFLQNLTKLFTMDVIDSSSKLKNLLYDILLSIRMLISENLSTNPSAVSNARLQQLTTSTPTGSSPFAKNTPTFLSPATPRATGAAAGSTTTTRNNIMNIVPPSYNNKLRYMLCDIRLRDGLIALDAAQRLYVYDSKSESFHKFYVKPFDMLEDASPMVGVNDSAISLQLFDASVDKKNPP